MIILILSIVLFAIGMLLLFVVWFANSMSSAPNRKFEGIWLPVAPLTIAAALLLIWLCRIDLSFLLAPRS